MTINSHCKKLNGGYGRLYHAAKRALNATDASMPDFILTSPLEKVPPSRFQMTMWDADEIPRDCLAWDRAKILIVPNEHNKKLFRRYAKRPVHVCPLFADTIFCHLPPARPFRFLCVARDRGKTEAKGLAQLTRLFTKAFPRERDVELVIKQSSECPVRWSYDSRIRFLRSDLPRAQYHNLIALAHCGVFLSGMEAWNLPLLELAAAGRPSLVIAHNGPADWVTAKTSYLLPFKLVKAPAEGYQGVGLCGFADDLGVISAMREAYEDQITLSEKGAAGARRAMDYTEARFGARLRAIVAQYGYDV